MNQKIENIIRLILSNQKITDEEKNNAVKALQDVNKELEITAFKLDRTEKVKKTTSILLEETIEELELKRKAVEAQNRELEIEKSLEKVRTVAMAMRKPDDMLEVCKTISLQLELLGVAEIRNVQTAIFYQQNGTYTNYEYYSKHNKTFITETTYTNNELHQEFAEKMIKGKGEFFITHIKGKEVIDWIAYQKTTNVFIDNYLETASSLNYYWFSLGPVALGISTYQPLTEEEINLFKRFLKVFELSYQRYLDIQKAEAQAREAEIQLALERVRARSLAMHNTSELQEVVNILAQQLHSMNLDINGGVFIVINDEVDKDVTLWASGGAADYVQKVTVPFLNSPIIIELMNAIKRKNNFFTEDRTDEEKISLFKHLFKFPPWNSLSQERKEELLSRKGGYTRSVVISNYTSISITNHNGKKFSDDENEILKRFGNVFEQSYIRFLDLQKAEAQAREAQIEAALEKVRSRSMAMRSSSEIGTLIYHLYGELSKLDAHLDRCFIMIVNPENRGITWWLAGKEGLLNENGFFVQNNQHPSHQLYLNYWEERRKKWTYLFEGKEKEEWDRFGFSQTELTNLPEPVKKDMAGVNKIYLSGSSDIFGCLVTGSFEPLSDEHQGILSRFASVFNQTYTRFLDLQKAEAQAREAQIELSLERIRSQVTAMRESSELLDIVVTMRSEFVALGHEAHYFWHMRWLPDKYEKAMTSGDGTRIGMVMTLPRHIHSDIKLLADWEKSDESTIIFPMDVETAVEYVHKMITLGDFEQVDPNAPTLDDIRHIGGLTFIMARTTHGEIGYSLPGIVVDPPMEDLSSLVRFAGVFDLAYKRFEDLKGAERQQREAQIELALERTRTQSMLMKHSSELNDISKTFHEQLLGLGIDSEFSFVWLPDEDKQEHMFWATWVNDINGTSQYQSKAVKYPLDKTEPGTAKCYADWESNQPVHETFVPPGKIDSFFASWEELLKGAVKFKPEFFPEGIYYTEAYMKYGCFGIDIRRPLTQEEKEILRRFSVEFERTYTRFLDLQKAEAQNKIIQAENERKSKELEDARQLQLAMLPKELPKLSKLDIAVHMQTATEVGGDYYDFSFKDNGSLNICLGDATGHGLKAGTIVSMMKSLFIADSARLEIKNFFSSSNEILKKMSLDKMMISFAMVNIYGREIKIANAGIPPVFIYRKEINFVEEVTLHGLPFGALRRTEYDVFSTEVNSGDTILLLSDGLPELQNADREMYGYDRLKRVFAENGGKSSNEIISALQMDGANWKGELEQNDDITFIAVKVK
ncbi:MAG TPA: PP2C family protein-serine/threonine phosphatase [Melioribacteraceae bacterium]|nr:PP2C family protein-serine/threonine phosphatase [Melioribacteraceae bacterium]